MNKTHQGVTPETVPDPEVLPEIGGPFLIVRPVDIKKKTKGGILLADETQEDIKFLCNVARVLSVGPYAYKSKELDQGDWFQGGNPKVGDYVVYARFVGNNIRFNGVDLKIIKDTDIRLKVADPSCLDTFVNIERS
jgi:co-chaperonin GroES (HSP10)